MSGAQGALPPGTTTATTYESKPGGENRTRTQLWSTEDQGDIQVEKIQEKVEDPAGKGGQAFGAGGTDPEKTGDPGVTGTAA